MPTFYFNISPEPNMSNLTQNDVLETGMEINDGSDDSQRWGPFTLLAASRQCYKARQGYARMKMYAQENFSAWKATMTVLTILQFIILIYVAEFVGQLRNLNGKKNLNNAQNFKSSY